jgi:hypothetical protein
VQPGQLPGQGQGQLPGQGQGQLPGQGQEVGSNSPMYSLQSPCIRELPGRRFVESTLGRTEFMSKIPKQK